MLGWLYSMRTGLERAAEKYGAAEKYAHQAFQRSPSSRKKDRLSNGETALNLLYNVVQNSVEDMFYFNLPLSEHQPRVGRYLDSTEAGERAVLVDWLIMVMEQAVLWICFHIDRPEDFDNMYFHTHNLIRKLSFRPKELDRVSVDVAERVGVLYWCTILLLSCVRVVVPFRKFDKNDVILFSKTMYIRPKIRLLVAVDRIFLGGEPAAVSPR